jgi:hypothetical protein
MTELPNLRLEKAASRFSALACEKPKAMAHAVNFIFCTRPTPAAI